jgi:hypothetical protein
MKNKKYSRTEIKNEIRNWQKRKIIKQGRKKFLTKSKKSENKKGAKSGIGARPARMRAHKNSARIRIAKAA